MSAATAQMGRQRLDLLMAERGVVDSRARARDAVLRGHVRIDGELASKPSQAVRLDATIEITDPAQDFVARSALKLAAGLDAFAIDPTGRECLDIGLSTGGFSQLLLRRGARHVVGIDVGREQLHASLRDEPRLTAIEGLNARDLGAEHLAGHDIDLLVCDVSFISVRLALPPALDLLPSGSDAVILVKPQFEAGRDAIGRGGLLRDPETAPAVAEGIAAWLNGETTWQAVSLIPSPLPGGDGNREFLLRARKP
ncbi:TlyA family RNA methyltransferase [Aureimonas sp. AU4]|uniref:TlyA family RNA methyltransferase n=1 Tax=Aureimonas sp. AU4 TaxID=1638163 RepID=UPI0009E85FE4|nr:TlyA family RNA methyltransferase [Aureimonas sp. AU4]